MGENLKVTSKATIISAIISVPFFLITGLIGLAGCVFFLHGVTDFNCIMQTMVKETAPIGMRCIIIAGMLSIVMSSADSFLNSASVSLINDVITPLQKKKFTAKGSLTAVRTANFLIGILAVVITLQIPNILDILLFSYSLWSPVILVPLSAALLGIKSSTKAFYLSMIFGGAASLIWQYALSNPFEVDGTIIGFFVNLLVFTIATAQEKKKPLQ